MFSVNIKGKKNPKLPHFVKLEAIFFKTGYARVSKVISITGPLEQWDDESQQFTSKSVSSNELNKRILEFNTKYLKVAEEWEEEGKQWAPVQWSHCFDTEETKNNKSKVLPVQQVLEIIIAEKYGTERIKNGQVLTSFNTAKNYKDLLARLIEFVKHKYARSFSNFYTTRVLSKLQHPLSYVLVRINLTKVLVVIR